MKNRSSVVSKKRPIHWVSFLDLSTDLDRTLSLVANLTMRADGLGMHQDEHLPEVGYWIVGYLGKRIALEHVYFGRSLRGAEMDPLQLKAEVWRIEKVRAAQKLRRKSRRSNRVD